MSNLKPASSIIPHAPGLAQPLARPVASPGIAHAPGLTRPQEVKPPPVAHAPGMSAHQAASQQAVAAVVAMHAAPEVRHEQPIRLPPHGSVHARMVPEADFDKIKRRRDIGVPEIGLAPPRQSQQGDAPPVQQMRQMTGLAPNSRSNSVVVDPSVVTAQEIPVLQFNGTVDDTDFITIMLGGPDFAYPFPTGLVGPTTAVVQAKILWGVGNTNFSAIVDWHQGTMLSLPANFLAVNALVGEGTATTLPTMKLSAAVAYGAVPSRPNRATNTVVTQTASIGGGASLSPLVAIPNFAVAVGINVGPLDSVTPAPGATANFTDFGVEFLGPGGAVVGTAHWEYRYSNNDNVGRQDSFTYPIPNGARYMRFGTPTGSSTSATLKVTCLFDLCF